MITAIDCHYTDDRTIAGACAIRQPGDGQISASQRVELPGAAAYVSGQFYQRELPAILAVIEACTWSTDVFVIDGYVDLGPGKPGLGRHLSEQLPAGTPIIGVGKNPYEGNDTAVAVRRAGVERPLFVTACGIEVDQAAELIRALHGAYRLPTLLRAVDALARGNVLQQ